MLELFDFTSPNRKCLSKQNCSINRYQIETDQMEIIVTTRVFRIKTVVAGTKIMYQRIVLWMEML